MIMMLILIWIDNNATNNTEINTNTRINNSTVIITANIM